MSADRHTGLKLLALAAGLSSLLALGQAHAQATLVVVNNNAAGVGFNDPTPVTPVGGNPGTTLGAQRLFATQHAANLWGSTLTSNAIIRIGAQFTALTCTETSAVLGSAGPASSSRNFVEAPFQNTWYPVALRNKLVGSELTPGAAQLNMNFNANLGTPGCLSASPWYLGVDNNVPPGAINLVVVLLHEFAHGLGFTVGPTSGSSGARNSGSPSVWERFMVDNQTGLSWFDMTTNAERAASAIGVERLVWTGATVTNAVPGVLRQGLGRATFSGPSAGALAGVSVLVGEAIFGTPISTSPFNGEVMPVVDQADGNTGLACTPLSPTNARAVNGKIALVDRGTCGFAIKAANVQAAGAVGMLVADNVAGTVPSGLSGADPTLTLRAARILQSDGVRLKTALRTRSRTSSGVFVSLLVSGTQFAGADTLGRIKLYTPNPFEGGSSVSHYDVSAIRNQLMEPAISSDLTQSVVPPQDLTFNLLRDIGW